jgi:hypothetical protein
MQVCRRIQSERRSPTRSPAKSVRRVWIRCCTFLLLLGCASGRGTPTSSNGLAASPTPGPVSEHALSTGEQQAPFSGEIVYLRTAVPNVSEIPPKILGEYHYFISGPHWKHVDEAGDVAVLYDPTTNVVHYFKPHRNDVDASVSDGPATFEPVSETKTVLGRTCRGIRQVSAQATFLEFYDPALYVDPKEYANHHHGHWAEFLAVKHGGLPLWDAVERDGYVLVSEAIRIVPRTFEPSFWAMPADVTPSE